MPKLHSDSASMNGGSLPERTVLKRVTTGKDSAHELAQCLKTHLGWDGRRREQNCWRVQAGARATVSPTIVEMAELPGIKKLDGFSPTRMYSAIRNGCKASGVGVVSD